MKRILYRFASAGFLTACLLTGCGEDTDPTRENDFVPLSSITVESPRPQIAVGTTNPFTATGDFSGVFSRDVTDEASWSSSNPDLLTIDETGRGRGIAPGEVTVTATLQDTSATLDFTVSDARAQTITLTPDVIEIPQGGTEDLTATAAFDDGTTQPVTDVVNWSSSDEAVATIDNSGRIRGVSPGSATVSAEFDSVSGEVPVTVTEATLATLELSPDSPVTTTTATVQFTLTGTFSNGTTEDFTSEATWTSSDTTVATIDSSGLATPEAAGITTITATAQGQSVSTDLEVANLDVIEITPDTSTPLAVNAERILTATGSFDTGESLDITDQVTWTSNNTAVATVGNTGTNRGIVTGVGGGTAEIQATLGDVSATTTVFVR